MVFACEKYQNVTLWIAGKEVEEVEKCLDEHAALFGLETVEDEDDSEPKVKFGFWSIGEKGPEREEKELDVPEWKEIRVNYSSRIANSIESLTANFKPGAGGRLLLWHGAPGTGKTFALRSLAWEWREWCQFEYIFDPEN